MSTLPSRNSHLVRNVNLLGVDQICFLCCSADTGLKVLLVILDLLLEVLSAYESTARRLHILVNVQVSQQLILTSSCRSCSERAEVSLLGTFQRCSHHAWPLWWHHAGHSAVRCCAFSHIEVRAVHLERIGQVHRCLRCVVKCALLGLDLDQIISCLLSISRMILLSFLCLWPGLGQKGWRTTYRDGGVRYLSIQLYGLITVHKVARRAVISHICPALCLIVVHLEQIVRSYGRPVDKSLRFGMSCAAFRPFWTVRNTWKEIAKK